MDKQLKHGTAARKKTRFSASLLGIVLLVIVWSGTALACSQSYVSAMDLTATAAVAPVGIGGGGIEEVAAPTLAVPTAAEVTPPAPTQPVVVETTAPAAPETAVTTTVPAATLAPTATRTSVPTLEGTAPAPIMYTSQGGDTLPVLAIRFGVQADEIRSNTSQPLPEKGFLEPGTLLIIPNRLAETGPNGHLLPDSEIVYSPSAIDFDVDAYINAAGGFLSQYREYLSDGWNTGAQVVERVALENSINPRLLLALLEHQSGWVFGQPDNLQETDYPMGLVQLDKKGLFKQLNWAMQKVSLGYYGWREGLYTELEFTDGTRLRMAPDLNAGTAAIQYFYSLRSDQVVWNGLLYGPEGFYGLYRQMFGDPWQYARAVEPLFPQNLTQPALELPFLPGRVWSLTGGPHAAWAKDGARAALDFAPSSVESGCVKSNDWVVASAPGLVTRSENGVVVVDLDGDGYEQTGWVILYLHIATQGRVPAGTILEQDDLIGHPSCEGGSSTGTHVHIARKYNGEWMLADGPIPFNLSGWEAHAGDQPYIGSLTKDGETVTASVVSEATSNISRPVQAP